MPCPWADHSLPFLQVCLHPDVVSVGRQVLPLFGDEPSDDVYMRNAGVNDMGPGFSIGWHHDGSYGVEFMHYFSGSSVANGCLRVVSLQQTEVLALSVADSLAGACSLEVGTRFPQGPSCQLVRFRAPQFS